MAYFDSTRRSQAARIEQLFSSLPGNRGLLPGSVDLDAAKAALLQQRFHLAAAVQVVLKVHLLLFQQHSSLPALINRGRKLGLGGFVVMVLPLEHQLRTVPIGALRSWRAK